MAQSLNVLSICLFRLLYFDHGNKLFYWTTSASFQITQTDVLSYLHQIKCNAMLLLFSSCVEGPWTATVMSAVVLVWLLVTAAVPSAWPCPYSIQYKNNAHMLAAEAYWFNSWVKKSLIFSNRVINEQFLSWLWAYTCCYCCC